jgi:hypothetical protein
MDDSSKISFQNSSSPSHSFDMWQTRSFPWSVGESPKAQLNTLDLQTAGLVFVEYAYESFQTYSSSDNNNHARAIACCLVSHSSACETFGFPYPHDQEARWYHRISWSTKMDL